MAPAKLSVGLCAALLLAGAIPALAQLSPSEPDPLARIREAAQSNVQACSATGETLCEQVAPKIIANAQGDSPLAENLRRLAKILNDRHAKTSAEPSAVAWAVEAFRDAGFEVHTEKYDVPAAGPKGKLSQGENVVAEFRGRDNSDEWVLLGAHLAPLEHGPWTVDSSCDAAEVIEAARDISQTNVHPRLSIRFVLFTGDMRKSTGSWAYVRSHRSELDHARAAIMIRSDCRRMTDYLLNGRPEIEAGVREAMKPIDSFGAGNFVAFISSVRTEAFDFLLEGVPTLTAFSALTTISVDAPAPIRAPVNIADIKRNAAIVAVAAFGIAERATPLGPRQSRTEIESLLDKWGLESQMKSTGLWTLWKSGERGRLP